MSGFFERLNRRVTAHFPVRPTRNRSERPLASISFDDFPRSAWTQGGAILRRHGVRATYYTVGGFAGRVVEGIEQYTIEDLQAAAAEGHEIASHTFSHKRVYALGNRAIVADEADNAAFFRTHLAGHDARGFAYPYGEVSPRTKLLYGRLYPACRGIRKGVNGRWFDAAQLKAVGIERNSWSRERIEAMVAEAVAKNAWVIFFTHDVTDDPAPYGATPQMLDHAIVTLRNAGIEILPVREAYLRALTG